MHVMTKANTTYVCSAKQQHPSDQGTVPRSRKSLPSANTSRKAHSYKLLPPGEADANYSLTEGVMFALPLSRAWVCLRLDSRRDMGFQFSMVGDDVMALWFDRCRSG
jgi:hypothetical protein